MTNNKYWKNYYKNKSPEEIPWDNPGDKFFNFLFNKYDLPKKGNVLDVGTGTGKKAATLAKKGYKVWAFDTTEEGFSEIKNSNAKVNFFVADAENIGSAEEIKGIKFNIVFDLLTSQFLSIKEKKSYLTGLNPHLSTNSYYILQTFYKGNNVKPSHIPWVNKVVQSKKDIEEIYGKYFNIIDISIKEGKKGTDALIVLNTKS